MKLNNRFTLFLFGLLLTIGASAQPLTYYQDAWNEDGDDLREALYDIIRVHTKLPYSSSSTDTWDVLKASDVDPSNSSNVLLIYAGISVNGPQEYNNGQGWNREHVWPRSLGGFGTSAGVGTDVHNLKPATISLNSTRSNHEYDELGTGGNAVNYNGNATGNRLNASAGIFEPRDDIKGDLARIIMYMDLRYEGQQGEPDLVMREALNSGGNTFAVMSTLIDWHFQDTVDQFELDRNDAIHNMQGNRNPFIDHPELVHYVYGDSVGVAWNPFMDVIIIECGFGEPIKYYPNPADTELHLETPFAGTAHLTSVDGKRFEFEHIQGTNRIDVSHLPSGQYTLGFSDGTKEKVLVVH
jgi:endonuclease I